ncbi:MAG: hypothetical protein PHQ47_02195 [Candidatus Portnoybacteria bacterium]|nr:hypothetical protein [Candidatus Portnoybacteria bacterium]
MEFFSAISDQINLGGNWLLILIFLAAGLGVGLALGRNRLSLMTLSVYISLAIVRAVPWTELKFIGVKEAPDTNVLIFILLALTLGIFFVAPHSGLASVLRLHGRGRSSWWQLMLLGVALLGFFVSVVISFLPAKALADLQPLLIQFFVEDLAQFVWLILPLAAMLVLKRRRASVMDED